MKIKKIHEENSEKIHFPSDSLIWGFSQDIQN